MNIKHIASRMRQVRGEKTQVEFAKLLGTSQESVSRWESGIGVPALKVLHKLKKKKLISSIDWLVMGQE